MRRVSSGAWILALACLAGPCRAQLTPLFVIPTQNAGGVTLPAGKPAHVRITSIDSAKLAAVLGAQAPADAPSFEYIIDAYPQLQSTAGRTWLEPTFMIDYDEPAFTKLEAEMKERGVRNERMALVKFVDDLVDEDVPRGWDLASVVATRRQGDCSEHAVLTAALARRAGLPARVVIGIALVSKDNEHAAIGHAWAEILEGGKWVIADAALNGLQQTVRYIPIGLIEDEGMGYKMGLTALTRRWVQKVEVLGAQ